MVAYNEGGTWPESILE